MGIESMAEDGPGAFAPKPERVQAATDAPVTAPENGVQVCPKAAPAQVLDEVDAAKHQ